MTLFYNKHKMYYSDGPLAVLLFYNRLKMYYFDGLLAMMLFYNIEVRRHVMKEKTYF